MLPSLLLQIGAPAARADSAARLTEAAYGLLIFGGALFWFVAALVVLVLTVQVAREAGVAAFLTLLAGTAVLAWMSHFPLRAWVLAHPAEVLRWVAIYYVGGVAWASWKFVRFHRSKVRPYLAWREQQLAVFGVTRAEDLSDEQAFHFQEAAQRAGFPLRSMGQIKNLTTYSRDFVFWASYWPFSLLATLLRVVVRDAFIAIFRGAFAVMRDRIRAWLSSLYRDVHADRDAVLAKAEAYRARRGSEGGPDGGAATEPGGGPAGEPGAGPRQVVVRRKS